MNSTEPVSIKRHYAEGTITSSLWNVMKEKGADPLLALKLSDVFAWQIDFFDVKEGDSFRVMYDVAYIDDTTATEHCFDWRGCFHASREGVYSDSVYAGQCV